jgi:hypothetical protein
MPSSDLIISIAGQIPIVVLFVWFTLKVINVHNTQVQEITAKFIASVESIQQLYTAAEKERSEHCAAALNRLSDELKANTIAVGQTHSTITAHDARNSDFLNAIVKSVVQK